MKAKVTVNVWKKESEKFEIIASHFGFLLTEITRNNASAQAKYQLEIDTQSEFLMIGQIIHLTRNMSVKELKKELLVTHIKL